MIALLNLALILTVVFSIRAFFYEPFHAVSSSMVPTIEAGDYLIVKKTGYGSYGTYGITILDKKPTLPIERGEILVFRFPPNPSLEYVKRVVGLPGDIIEFKENGLFLNGQLVEVQREIGLDGKETFFQKFDSDRFGIVIPPDKYRAPKKRYKVPPDHLFVMGDNRPNSNDSRYWGFLPTDNVVGRVSVIF